MSRPRSIRFDEGNPFTWRRGRAPAIGLLPVLWQNSRFSALLFKTVKLLALDTATEACSAALWIDGEVRERFEVAPRGHARLLLPFADALLAEEGMTPSDLDALAVGRGPGSFTGVRIAVSVAQGIAFAARLPVVAVSTLAALAHTAMEQHGCERVAAAIDARMGEVYWGCFDRDGTGVTLHGEEAVLPPAGVSVAGNGWFCAGSGWESYAETIGARLGGGLNGSDGSLLPRAASVAHLASEAAMRGEGREAAELSPIYLRDRVTHQR